MKKLVLFTCLVLLLISCTKENKYSFIAKYQGITGTWETNAISYDSSGITIVKSTRYDRLVINNNLEYHVYMNITNLVENGSINIIEQTNNKLVLYFAAEYPSYSSYAGSHIFGVSNAILVSLTKDEMIFKSAYTGLFNNLQFYFKKL
jgi:hypothetical protein